MSAYRLYAITPEFTDVTAMKHNVFAAIDGGITMLQIRIKHCDTAERVQKAAPLLAACRERGIPCIINDDVEAAKILGADGVHLGQADMPIQKARAILGKSARIGTSAHNVNEAIRAQADGADYIGCGSVFTTRTKSDATALSRETLCEICRAVSIPVVAIGGITLEGIPFLANTGIAGVAVISAIFGQADVCAAASQLRKCSEQICEGNV